MPPLFSGPESIMTSTTTAKSKLDFQGNMFLYDKPALLSKKDHGGLGLSKPARPFDFAKAIKGLPLVAGEIQSAQKHYPVVFSDFENPVLLAVVGIIDDDNLFVTDSGEWDPNSYIPSYARCHPFALAASKEDEYVVIIDESSNQISETPEFPFFDGDELSPVIQPRLDLCGQFNVEQKQTQAFCQKVKDLGLLNGQRVNETRSDGSEEKIADYVSIDPKRLNDLDKDTLQELHQDGSLAAIFAQVFSLENWNRLIARRSARLGSA